MSQREKIQQFKSFTDESSDSIASRYLKEASWNVEHAVNAYYDSPPARPTPPKGAFAEAVASQWFDTYRDVSLSGDKFSVDGIQQFATDLGIDPNDPVLFVFAWKCNCQQICEFTRQEFLAGLRDPAINADSIDKFKAKLGWLRTEIEDRENFRAYYNWIFGYAKESHARHMDQATAVSIWPMVLPKFQFCQQWIEFLETTHNKPINRDTWVQLLPFAILASDNPTLDTYDPADSWPVLIDTFVDWLRKNNHIPANQ